MIFEARDREARFGWGRPVRCSGLGVRLDEDIAVDGVGSPLVG